jgi:hypothetical protein
MWKSAFVFLMLCGSGFAAQIPAARFQISGRTLKAGSLSVAPSDSSIASVQASTGSRQVQVRVRPSLSDRSITVALIARSNSPYRLLVKSVGRQNTTNPSPVRVLVRSVDPNAGSTHLTPDAINVRTIEDQLVGTLNEITILEGPRISSGGNDATIDNAIRLNLEVELPQDASETELIFTMDFPAN